MIGEEVSSCCYARALSDRKSHCFPVFDNILSHLLLFPQNVCLHDLRPVHTKSVKYNYISIHTDVSHMYMYLIKCKQLFKYIYIVACESIHTPSFSPRLCCSHLLNCFKFFFFYTNLHSIHHNGKAKNRFLTYFQINYK